MAIRKKSDLVPPTLHYCGHTAYCKWPLIRCTIQHGHLHQAIPYFLLDGVSHEDLATELQVFHHSAQI